MKGRMDDGGKVRVRSERQENKGNLKKKKKAAPAEEERERGCSLSAPEGMKQESVAETDRAQAERPQQSTTS